MSRPEVFNLATIPPYQNYLHLLGQTVAEPDDTIDAIIVPQARSARHIISSARLAHASGSMLISLCSHEAKSSAVADVIGDMPDAPDIWYAIDVPPGYAVPGADLRADQEIPDQARKPEGWNLSDKRNGGLAVGRMIGANSIFYKDDDNKVSKQALREVGLMLFRRHIAGLGCGGFPDKSVIQHAKSEIYNYHLGKRWKSEAGYDTLRAGQISANSMGVNPQLVFGHFPRRVYNEDWLFAFPSVSRQLAMLAPGMYYQDEYDPFVSERAEQEEFGEVLIDGLYPMLESDAEDKFSEQYSPKFWQKVIREREQQYESLLGAIKSRRNERYFSFMTNDWVELLQPMPPEQQARLREPLEAGLAVNRSLTGSDFAGYERVRAEDQGRWQGMMNTLPRNLSVKEALSRLDLTSYVTNQ